MAVVGAHEGMIFNEMGAAAARDRAAYADQLSETRIHPNDGTIKYYAGKLVGKAMDGEEAGYVNARGDAQRRAEVWQATADQEREGLVNTLEFRVRRQFGLLDRPRKARIDEYLDREVSPFLREQAAEARAAGKSWTDWLAQDATDEQVINLLQWNVAKSEDRQRDPAFAEAVAGVRRDYKEKVARGVAEGWFSEQATDRLSRADDVKIWVADPFQVAVTEIRGDNLPGTIGIAPPETDDPELYEKQIKENVRQVLPHELNHQAIQNVEDTEPLGQRWIMEALTEVSAVVLRGEAEPYPGERQLLSRLLVGGSRQLDLRLATRAYTGGPDEKQALLSSLDASWGTPNVLEKVTAFIRETETKLLDKGFPRLLAQSGAVEWAADFIMKYPHAMFGFDYVKPERRTA